MRVHSLRDKTALLLDMNSTFMFGEDRFDDAQDYSKIYRHVGGILPAARVNRLIAKAFEYLSVRYPDAGYRQHFPSVAEALRAVSEEPIAACEIARLVETFAYHERGHVSAEYVQVLHRLAEGFRLGLVIDVWAPKDSWLAHFQEIGIMELFEAISFSSDHRHVKPSPHGFRQVLAAMRLPPRQALFIGDSVRRDLAGARAAGLDCVLVGGARSALAMACYADLSALCEQWLSSMP
ncbi:MAG: HAD family hydrolase [Chromatiales bacterium]|nr:HAD family hydrolase [Chromatiales bacterium]